LKLRNLLLLLTLAILLPVAIFGVAASFYALERERQVFIRGAGERTNALITAVDTELARHRSGLLSLASSNSLRAGNMHEFHTEMLRLLPTQNSWQEINLTLESGDIVLSTGDIDRFAKREAVGSCHAGPGQDFAAAPSIGTVLKVEGGPWVIPVCIPVQARREAMILSAMVDPQAFLALLTPQRLRDGWVGAVLADDERIVARTANNTLFLGEPASVTLRSALSRQPQGWFAGRLIEGTAVYTSYIRSSNTGWIVALGVPAVEFEAIGRTTISVLTTGLLASILIALVFATMLGRRISRPMQSLADAARSFGRIGKLSAPTDSSITEVNEVSQALEASATAVAEREQKLRAADSAKDDFLAMLGHELRNPLGVLTSASEMLRVNGSDSAVSGDAADLVRLQVSKMTRLVDDLLDVSRVTSRKVRLIRAPVRLDDVVCNVVDTMRELSAFVKLQVTFDHSPVWVNGDETRLEQVAFNLLENAAKYTPENGKIAVRVARDGEIAVLEITDTGIGMSEELKARVFDLFAQGDRTIDRSIGGLGIGLTLVKRLVELHGGSVELHSAGIDRGTRFTVRLPAIEKPAEPVRRDEPQPVDVQSSCKVLLVEDNDDARNALLTILRHFGYLTYGSSDGMEGIDMAAKIRPHVAIVDIGLPKCSGYEVAKRIRSDSRGECVFLIALTGYGGEKVRQQVAEAGFDEYLIKPVAPADLADLIRSRVASVGSR
jgi:signal transduction histidine kinase/ActR/RegA family two-component response regulator